MKKSRDLRTLAPVDSAQRYTIKEATSYLRISHASIYKEISAGRIRVLKHGKRTFVPGSEIARLSQFEAEPCAVDNPTTNTPERPPIKETTAYRLLDSRIHQALMKDIARQQALWDSIQKFDSKIEHLTRLVEKLAPNPRPRDVRVAESLAPQAQFLRLKEVIARIGLRSTTIYHYVSLGAFPKPRKFGRSSLWVTSEVNDWIAKRAAGVPMETDGQEAI
jgi:prophage regulatory protein